jgi:voltage-gated potassium channel
MDTDAPVERRAAHMVWIVSAFSRALPAKGEPGCPAQRSFVAMTAGAGDNTTLHENRSVSIAPGETDREDLKSTTYEFFVLAISVMSIVNTALLFVLPFDSQSWWLVAIIDAVLTIIFLVDFTYRLSTAPTKRSYLRHGGVFDLLGCIPGLRIFRLFRIVRAVRIVRRLGGPRVFGELRAGLASGTLYLVVFLGLLTLEVTGLLKLRFEEDAPGANITTAGDAIWWGYVTATTVGYGDQFPVTTGGRIVGVLMLTVGVALFATFSGFLATLFLSTNKGAPEHSAVASESDLQATLQHIERLHAEQQAALDQLRAQIGPPQHVVASAAYRFRLHSRSLGHVRLFLVERAARDARHGTGRIEACSHDSAHLASSCSVGSRLGRSQRRAVALGRS